METARPQSHVGSALSLFLAVLLLFGALYATVLLVQRQSLFVHAQSEIPPDENGGGGLRFTSKYGEHRSYRCRGPAGTILSEEYDDGTPTKTIKDCAEIGQTCYELDNQVKGEYTAACLYNPPTSKGGGEGCPTLEQIAANRKTTPQTCKYFNPSIDIFDTNITSEQIATYRNLYLKEFVGKPLMGGSIGTEAEFDRRVQSMVSQAQSVGINPVILLGYWKSESRFSTFGAGAGQGSDLGCAPGQPSMLGFDKQVQCALGQVSGGASEATCAVSRGKNSPPCRFEQGRIDTNPEIFKPDPSVNYRTPVIPISTFDDYADLYGPRSPLLDGGANNNCVHTYNDTVEVAVQLGACKASSGGGSLASCKFTRGGDSQPYQSQRLLGHMQEVANKTGVPAAVLGAVVKVEATTDLYNISDYSDQDLGAMENASAVQNYIDTTINNGTKALCPRSYTGALGVMQIQPPIKYIRIMDQHNAQKPLRVVNGQTYDPYSIYPRDGSTGPNCDDCIKNGLRLAREADYKSTPFEDLTLTDYCDPKMSLYIGAGFILKKLQYQGIGNGLKWDPAWTNDENILRAAARGYYGNDAQTRLYEDSLVQSVKQCSASSPGSLLGAKTSLASVPTKPSSTKLRQATLEQYTLYGFMGVVGLYIFLKIAKGIKNYK